MALRSIRPSVEEVAKVQADPTALAPIVASYVESPLFGAMIRNWQTELWQVGMEGGAYYAAVPNSALFGKTAVEIQDGLLQENGRLVEHIVMNNLPFTEIVTANYTMMNGITAAVHGQTHPGAFDEWTKTNWDGVRPAAGILATSSIFMRHASTASNFNRGRANAISDILLCHDFLSNDIKVDTSVDLNDPVVVSSAVVSNPSCAGCHQTLDPLASTLFGFALAPGFDQIINYPRKSYYLKAGEWRWQSTNHRPPAYFGVPVSGLEQLAGQIAGDRRFASCAVKRLASELLQRPVASVDIDWSNRLTDQFVAGGYQLKQLAATIVQSPQFAVSHAATATDTAKADQIVGLHRATPRQWANTIENLTGFRWRADAKRIAPSKAYEKSRGCDDLGQQCDPSRPPFAGTNYGIFDVVTSNYFGFGLLAGGTDAFFSPEPMRTMSTTSLLVLQTLAAEAAQWVVENESALAANDRKVFNNFDLTKFGKTAVKQQLVSMSQRFFADTPELAAERADDLFVLFDELRANGLARAWTVTLAAMLSDPDMAYF
jgi:hypothetical protein